MSRYTHDLCIIGAGAAGLSTAAGAAQLGAKVVLVERGAMGGDCLNVGCVPSKALLAAAHAVGHMRRAAALGVHAGDIRIDAAAVKAHVRRAIAAIAPVDSEERYRGFGVEVLKAEARFTDADTVVAGQATIRARRFVLAVGLSPAVPPIPGLTDGPFLTNEQLFEGDQLPPHLLVLGGGAIGTEMAEAHRLLGCEVTLVEAGRLLGRDDGDLVDRLRQHLIGIGIRLIEGVGATAVEWSGTAPTLVLADGQRLAGSHLLVAAGRQAAFGSLHLEAAGIAHTSRGITVDARLITSNRRVLAIGDAAGGAQFTHVAGGHASTAILNTLFGLPAKAHTSAIPSVVYTDPELASVGLTEAAARKAGRTVEIATWSFHENDRAIADGSTEGLVKLVIEQGRVIGAQILGAHAGELIAPWCIAVAQRQKLSVVQRVMLPYPTRAEAAKRAAGQYLSARLFTPRMRWIVRLLQRLP